MSDITCSVEDCEKAHYGKGLCNMHYQRLRKTGTTDARVKVVNYCKAEGCGLELTPPYGHGYCSNHYWRFAKYGDPFHVPGPRKRVVGVDPCSIEGCENVIQARGWCSAHWTRWDRTGDPLTRKRAEVIDGKRVCPQCQVDKPVNRFSHKSGGPCKPCVAATRAEWRKENPPPSTATWREAQCVCGKVFQANKQRSRYCSRECNQANRNKANWPHGVARQMRMRAAFVEKFDRIEIFERDGWICQLCDGPVDRLAAWPDQSMASLDHIIPISRGGKHSRANAQTSHLGCNVRKGAKVPA